MKKLISAVITLALAISLGACASSESSGGSASPASAGGSANDSASVASAATKTYQIGFTTAAVENDPYFVFAQTFSDLVAEKTDGAIRINVMGGGQLGQEREMFEGMQLGTADMAVMTNAYASSFVPASGLFDLPFLFSDSTIAASILDGDIGQAVLNEYTSKGVTALAWGEGGFRHLVTMNNAVRMPDDFKGLKIRCMETETYIATYSALGTNAVPMAWAETITGLQQGTIDGLDIPISVIYSNGFPDIAKYLNLTGHFYSPLLICVSNSIFNDLDETEQQILRECAVEAGIKCRQNNAAVEETMLTEMEEQGMTIVRDVNLAAFQAVLGDFYMNRADSIGGTYVEDLLAVING